MNALYSFDGCYDRDCGVYWLGCLCYGPRKRLRIARTHEQELQRFICGQRRAVL